MDDIAAFTPLQLRWNSYLSNANMAPKLGILILNVLDVLHLATVDICFWYFNVHQTNVFAP